MIHDQVRVFWRIKLLRVVRTKAILFLKSMSERVGSDMERLWIRMGSSLETPFQRRSMSDPTVSDIDFKNKMALVWTTLNFDKKTVYRVKIQAKIMVLMFVHLKGMKILNPARGIYLHLSRIIQTFILGSRIFDGQKF